MTSVFKRLRLASHSWRMETALSDAPIFPFSSQTPFALGEDVRSRCAVLESASDHFLRVAQTVKCGGIDPVHSVVESSVDRRNRVAVILRTHTSIPTTTADRPCA